MVAGLVFVVDFERMLQYRANDPTKRRRIKRDLSSILIKGIAGITLRRLYGVDDEVVGGPDANGTTVGASTSSGGSNAGAISANMSVSQPSAADAGGTQRNHNHADHLPDNMSMVDEGRPGDIEGDVVRQLNVAVRQRPRTNSGTHGGQSAVNRHSNLSFQTYLHNSPTSDIHANDNVPLDDSSILADGTYNLQVDSLPTFGFDLHRDDASPRQLHLPSRSNRQLFPSTTVRDTRTSFAASDRSTAVINNSSSASATLLNFCDGHCCHTCPQHSCHCLCCYQICNVRRKKMKDKIAKRATVGGTPTTSGPPTDDEDVINCTTTTASTSVNHTQGASQSLNSGGSLCFCVTGDSPNSVSLVPRNGNGTPQRNNRRTGSNNLGYSEATTSMLYDLGLLPEYFPLDSLSVDDNGETDSNVDFESTLLGCMGHRACDNVENDRLHCGDDGIHRGCDDSVLGGVNCEDIAGGGVDEPSTYYDCSSEPSSDAPDSFDLRPNDNS